MNIDKLETMGNIELLAYVTQLERDKLLFKKRLQQQEKRAQEREECHNLDAYYKDIIRKISGKSTKYLTGNEKTLVQMIVYECFFGKGKRDGNFTWVSFEILSFVTGHASVAKKDLKTVMKKVLGYHLFISREEKNNDTGYWLFVPDDFIDRLSYSWEAHDYKGPPRFDCPGCGKKHIIPKYEYTTRKRALCPGCDYVLKEDYNQAIYHQGEQQSSTDLTREQFNETLSLPLQEQESHNENTSSVPQPSSQSLHNARIHRLSSEQQTKLDREAQERVEENKRLADEALSHIEQYGHKSLDDPQRDESQVPGNPDEQELPLVQSERGQVEQIIDLDAAYEIGTDAWLAQNAARRERNQKRLEEAHRSVSQDEAQRILQEINASQEEHARPEELNILQPYALVLHEHGNGKSNGNGNGHTESALNAFDPDAVPIHLGVLCHVCRWNNATIIGREGKKYCRSCLDAEKAQSSHERKGVIS